MAAQVLMADLAQMATEAEAPAARLSYIADSSPEQFRIERFSVDTGIDTINLDDWQAATSTDRPSIVEARTKEYLDKPDVRHRLQRAAIALADVYVGRQAASENQGIETATDNTAQVQTSPFLDVSAAPTSKVNIPIMQGIFNLPESSLQTPSLLPPSEPTQSLVSSPPRTPEPLHPGIKITVPKILTENTDGLLNGQGEQFNNSQELGHPSSPSLSPVGPSRSGSRKVRRSMTYPLPMERA